MHPQAPINHPQRNQHAPEPDVRLRDDSAALVSGEAVVVEESAEGLEEQQAEEREADFGVVVVELGGRGV